MSPNEEKLREILSKHGGLATPVEKLTSASDLYMAGLTSLATVSVMLAVEDQFDIEIPDHMLGRKTFVSIDSMLETVETLSREKGAE